MGGTRGEGTNQYVKRGLTTGLMLVMPATDLRVQAALRGQLFCRCGEIWGTDCTVPISPPDWSHGDHPDRNSRVAATANPDCPAVILDLLGHDLDQEVYSNLVRNPSCPPITLERLYWSDRAEHTEIVSNPACPTELLERFSQDQEGSVRRAAATAPRCPAAVLQRLGRDSEFYVREAVASHPSCPAATLEGLGEDRESWVVRQSVARNPSSSAILLERLLHDLEPAVAQAAAANQSLSRAALAMWQLAHSQA